MLGAPSYALGMARARLRLIRDPDTDEPYFFMGLCAPHAAFTLLGQGTSCHVQLLMYAFYFALASLAFAIPLLLMPHDPNRKLEAGTAGAWSELTWGLVLCDVGLLVVRIQATT